MCQNGLFTICLGLVHDVLDGSKSTNNYCWSHLLKSSGNLVAQLIIFVYAFRLKPSPLLTAKAPLYLPLILHELEKDTRILNPKPSLLKVKRFGGVSDFLYIGFQNHIFFVSLHNFDQENRSGLKG